MVLELTIRARERMCSNCLSYDEIDAFCPMCGECSQCCECSMLAIRGSISKPAYAGQYQSDTLQEKRAKFWSAVFAISILAYIVLRGLGVIP